MREENATCTEVSRRAKTPGFMAWGRAILHRHWRTLYVFVMILADAAAMLLSGATAYIIREMVPEHSRMTPGDAARVAVPATIFCISVAFLTGLYRTAYRTSYAEQYREAAKAYICSTVIVYLGMHLAMGLGFPPRFTLFFLVLVPFYFGFLRWLLNLANRNLQRWGHGRQNSIIVNWHGLGSQLLYRFTIFPELGYAVKAFVCATVTKEACNPASCVLQHQFRLMKKKGVIPASEVIPCYTLDEIETAIENHHIEGVFVPLLKSVTGGFSQIVNACLKKRIRLKVISPASEMLLRFSRVKDIAGITIYAPPRTMLTWTRRKFKRVFDVCFSGLLIVLLSPLFTAIAVAILIEDGRPILFVQRRSSMRGGKYFEFFKFRSMIKNAEASQSEFNRLNQTEDGLFLVEKDPRITRVGQWIRRFSFDELPQLFNVLRGDMSLVGPRPLAQSDLQNVSAENDYAAYYSLRGRVRPGMTGLWQICGRREVPFREMVLLDLYYIENQSVTFDLEILFGTIPVVLFGRGAH